MRGVRRLVCQRTRRRGLSIAALVIALYVLAVHTLYPIISPASTAKRYSTFKTASPNSQADYRTLEDWLAGYSDLAWPRHTSRPGDGGDSSPGHNTTGRGSSPQLAGQDPANHSMDTAQSSGVLLAGNPRSRTVHFSIGLVTVSREKGEYFFDTMNALLEKSSESDKKELTIVVMLADRQKAKNEKLLEKIKQMYHKELKEGLLLVIRGANTEFLFESEDLKRTYNDSVARVQWRSKQNLDYAALMEFSANLSTFYLHLEDDVVAEQNYLRYMREFIRLNSGRRWAVLEVSPKGFIGKLFRNSDLSKLVTVLRTFYLEQPCDFLLPYFFKMMVQDKHLVYKKNLFLHRGEYSSLRNVTRKIDDHVIKRMKSQRGKPASAGSKPAVKHVNPPATVTTDMTVYNDFQAKSAYTSEGERFFWAKEPLPNQSLTIIFPRPQKLSKIEVRTGHPDKENTDVLRKGSVHIGTEKISSNDTSQCARATKMGDFVDGSFTQTETTGKNITCIKIVVDEKQAEWLIISDILVYVRK